MQASTHTSALVSRVARGRGRGSHTQCVVWCAHVVCLDRAGHVISGMITASLYVRTYVWVWTVVAAYTYTQSLWNLI